MEMDYFEEIGELLKIIQNGNNVIRDKTKIKNSILDINR